MNKQVPRYFSATHWLQALIANVGMEMVSRKENSTTHTELLAPGMFQGNPSMLFYLRKRPEHLLDTLTRASFSKCEIHDFDLSLL